MLKPNPLVRNNIPEHRKFSNRDILVPPSYKLNSSTTSICKGIKDEARKNRILGQINSKYNDVHLDLRGVGEHGWAGKSRYKSFKLSNSTTTQAFSSPLLEINADPINVVNGIYYPDYTPLRLSPVPLAVPRQSVADSEFSLSKQQMFTKIYIKPPNTAAFRIYLMIQSSP